jgi:hypothetical protein
MAVLVSVCRVLVYMYELKLALLYPLAIPVRADISALLICFHRNLSPLCLTVKLNSVISTLTTLKASNNQNLQ